MKKLLFKFFAWRLEIKLAKLQNDERCLFLANKLYTELQKQGHEMKSTDELSGCDVRLYTYAGAKQPFRVCNILSGWEIKGDRT